jgi:hypothetical protein
MLVCTVPARRPCGHEGLEDVGIGACPIDVDLDLDADVPEEQSSVQISSPYAEVPED